ncbi:MAG: hypothetical protein M3381_04880 [Actinomycetota bacterium]|nr:hypothetical protein [Actinomycetota bacterium]
MTEAAEDCALEFDGVLGVHLVGGRAYLAYRSKEGNLVDDPALRRLEP